jgi:hypothetical protein
MRKILVFYLLLGFAQLRAQNTIVNTCNIPESCHPGLIQFANDFFNDVPKDCKLWNGACGYDGEIYRTGTVNIGLGGPNTNGYKLLVQGGIISEQLKICKTEWCDYVFEPDYALRSLPEVSKWLGEHGYLPGCTPQSEIEQAGGYQLEEVTAQQQEKIEEIYLHLVALNKRLDVLQKQYPPLTIAPAPATTSIPNKEVIASNLQINGMVSDTVQKKERAIVAENSTCLIETSSACQTAMFTFLQQNVTDPICDQWKGGCTQSGTQQLSRSGNVCIGTDISQSGFSLAVKGGITTDKFQVELCEKQGWCDYVFAPDYPLLPIDSVGKYIATHQHLPGMVSQAEIKEREGYLVKDVKMQQQVKIEEAYLHLLQLEQRKKALEQRISNF